MHDQTLLWQLLCQSCVLCIGPCFEQYFSWIMQELGNLMNLIAEITRRNQSADELSETQSFPRLKMVYMHV